MKKTQTELPIFLHIDHTGLIVPNLNEASRFYCEAFGAEELYGLSPWWSIL
ncbi:VOC family protein [Tenacibaculum sp. UWU-22]|uniref:VOC family protein n=1 Tax=Tenacibaculum sp. UWU-22 TaxID=3234187 RepID=UPI0034DAE7E3